MIKKLKKLVLFLVIFFWVWLTFSYQVDVPNSTNDINSQVWWTIDDLTTYNYYQSLAKTINDYLWFIFGSVALWMVLYGWILLISSNGDPADLKKANKILIWGLVWIFVSLLAYLIIKLLINLF